jgi:hypothetical protein
MAVSSSCRAEKSTDRRPGQQAKKKNKLSDVEIGGISDP